MWHLYCTAVLRLAWNYFETQSLVIVALSSIEGASINTLTRLYSLLRWHLLLRSTTLLRALLLLRALSWHLKSLSSSQSIYHVAMDFNCRSCKKDVKNESIGCNLCLKGFHPSCITFHTNWQDNELNLGSGNKPPWANLWFQEIND